MTKIAFLCSWGETPEELLNRYRVITPGNSGKWNEIVGVKNLDEADYYVIMQDYEEGRDKLDPSKKIYFKREPHYITNVSFENKPGKHKMTYDKWHHVSVWWVQKTYDELKAIKAKQEKKKICCIVSGKSICNGHTKRLEYVKKLADSDIDIDIYGRWLDTKGYGEKYKGGCEDKYDVLSNYEYSITLENGSINNYFTEKLLDPILSWSIPIYWGCPNVFDFFPKDSIKYIDIHSDDCVEMTKNIIKDSPDELAMKGLETGRERILDSYNLWASVEKIINNKPMI